VGVDDGRLLCADSAATRSVEDLIARAALNGCPGVVGELTLTARAGEEVDLLVVNLPPVGRSNAVSTAVFVTARTQVPARSDHFERLAARWQLTQREAALAIAITTGSSIADA